MMNRGKLELILAYARQQKQFGSPTCRIPPGDMVEIMERLLAQPVSQGYKLPDGFKLMPLEITAVRVERLNDISQADAKAEGVKPAGDMLPDYPDTFLTPKGDFAIAKVAFQRLWQSIYGEESWAANPWVWIIEFKQVSAREVERG